MTRAHETSASAAPQLRDGGHRRDDRRYGGPGRGGLSRRVASGLLTTLIVVVVLFLALLAVPGLFGYGTLVVRSGSMEQTAPVGSLVLARPLDTRDVLVGDVILVRQDGATAAAPVLHRVISLTHRGAEIVVTTKGDSNAAPDKTPYLLRGTTMTPVLAVPHVGRAFAFVHTPLGWALLIALPATVLLCAQLRTIWFPVPRRAAHRSRANGQPVRRWRRRAAHQSSASRFLTRRRAGSAIPNDHASTAV
jgi:signal peptidase I